MEARWENGEKHEKKREKWSIWGTLSSELDINSGKILK